MKLFDYQEKIAHDLSKRMIAMMGRQSGMSTTVVERALFLASQSKFKPILIIEPNLRFCGMLKNMFWSTEKIEDSGSNYVTPKKGSRILILPARSSVMRGCSVNHVIIENLSLMKEEIFDTALLCLAFTNGSLTVFSVGTDAYKKDYNGCYIRDEKGNKIKNLAYRLWTDNNNWTKHKVPTHLCTLINREYLKRLKLIIPLEEYKQQLDVEFTVMNFKEDLTKTLAKEVGCCSERSYKIIESIIEDHIDKFLEGSDYGYCPDCDQKMPDEPLRDESRD